MNDLLDWALRYASIGFHIFPILKFRTVDGRAVCACRLAEKCTSPGKHPGVKWATQATCDHEKVRAWDWRRYGGIGCATGPSGLLVADADGPAGAIALHGLLGGGPVVTARARTARGFHVYFRGEAPTSSDPVTKLDVRSTGGYVVLPPSPHASGAVYAWEVPPWGDGPHAEVQWNVADCPPALLAYAQEKKKRRPAGMSGRQGVEVVSMGCSPEGVASGVRLPDYLACASPDFTEALGRVLREPDWGEVARALACIPANCKMDEWVRVGMALHHASNGSLQGLDLWDKWSSGSEEKYKGRGETEYSWSRWEIREDGVGLGSLFDLAFRHGYKRQIIEAAAVQQHAPVGGQQGSNSLGESAQAAEVVDAAPYVNGTTYEFPEELTRAPIRWVDTTEEGKPRHTCANAVAAVRSLGIACDGDRFHERYEVGGRTLHEWAGELSDEVVAVVRTMMRMTYRFDPGTLCVHDALVAECLANSFHPLRDYFDGLRWDGVRRIDAWMVNYLGANDDPFNRAVGRLSLIAAVRRVLKPGCKFDHIIVLEGPEGRGKSTAIEILAGPENFSDQTILSLDDKAQQEAVSGVWLYEIADLAGHSRAEVEKVKAFASRTTDRARPAYGRRRVDKPRTCVFYATTNDKTYLKSQTGNRRFWPVECGLVDLEGLRRDRDQLWAEAVQAEKGASLFLPESLWGDAHARQESRRDIDPWDDLLVECEKLSVKIPTSGGETEMRIASSTIINMILEIPAERQGDMTSKRLGHAMRRLGWEGPIPVWLEGKTYRGFTRRVRLKG